MATEQETKTPPTPDTDSYKDAKAAFDAIRSGTHVERGGKEAPAPQIEAVPEDEPEEAQQEEAKETKDLSKERDFLRMKAKVPAKVLDDLSEEELSLWYADMQAREAGLEKRLQESAEARKQYTELQQRLEALEAPKEPEGSQPPPALDLDELLQPLKEEIGDDGTTKLSSALQKALSPLQESLTALQRDNQSLRKQVEEAQGSEAQRTLEAQRKRLSSKKELSDRQFRALALEADDLAQKGDVTGWDEAFDQAFTNIYGDLTPEKADDEEKEISTPTVHRRKPETRAVSEKDKARMVFNAQRRRKNPLSGDALKRYAEGINVKT